MNDMISFILKWVKNYEIILFLTPKKVLLHVVVGQIKSDCVMFGLFNGNDVWISNIIKLSSQK